VRGPNSWIGLIHELKNITKNHVVFPFTETTLLNKHISFI
jgi:hypothetical protein